MFYAFVTSAKMNVWAFWCCQSVFTFNTGADSKSMKSVYPRSVACRRWPAGKIFGVWGVSHVWGALVAPISPSPPIVAVVFIGYWNSFHRMRARQMSCQIIRILAFHASFELCDVSLVALVTSPNFVVMFLTMLCDRPTVHRYEPKCSRSVEKFYYLISFLF